MSTNIKRQASSIETSEKVNNWHAKCQDCGHTFVADDRPEDVRALKDCGFCSECEGESLDPEWSRTSFI